MRSLLILLILSSAASAADPRALVEKIDSHIEARLGGVKPAPAATDAEFLRRASLDITGRIPTAHEVHEFLDSTDPDKRAKLIEELLDTPQHAAHFAALWRAALVPETTAVPEARIFRPGFEAWLAIRFRTNTKYDALVRELLAAPISGDADAPSEALKKPGDANPLAFFAVKDAKPENLAAAASRVFLGVQIECAQCHDHPFAKWTRDQFWNTAAFFAGVERHGDGVFAPISEKTSRREISPAAGKQPVPARFLDDREPAWQPKDNPRAVLAAWITAWENPYFAKATVNRVWGLFFGRGLVDPVDDFRDDNPCSHPELLNDLAKAFADSGFDLRLLVKAVCATKAYGRTSARSGPGQDDPRLVARAAVRGLTGEQLYDSLVRATGFRNLGTGTRDQFLTRFAPTGKPTEPETSIPQALALMNGRLIGDATSLEMSPTLRAACETPGLKLNDRIDLLYIAALGRKPTAKEADRMTQHVTSVAESRQAERLGDVFWVLLNSAEFRLNH